MYDTVRAEQVFNMKIPSRGFCKVVVNGKLFGHLGDKGQSSRQYSDSRIFYFQLDRYASVFSGLR